MKGLYEIACKLPAENEELRVDLLINKWLLAKQCDLAREAEAQAMNCGPRTRNCGQSA